MASARRCARLWPRISRVSIPRLLEAVANATSTAVAGAPAQLAPAAGNSTGIIPAIQNFATGFATDMGAVTLSMDNAAVDIGKAAVVFLVIVGVLLWFTRVNKRLGKELLEGGIIVGLFVIFHLLDLTWGQLSPHFVRGDPYDNMYLSFQRVWVAVVYIVANIALGIHIFHGAWSMFQSLGWNNPRYNRWRRYFATGFAGLIIVGNVSMPLLITTGAVSR